MRSEAEKVLNDLLVKLFNDILKIEEKSLREGDFSDLSVTEMHIIEAIGRNVEKTMSEVAGVLNVTVGTLTTAINRLIRKGYVERKRIEEDRRVVLIKLTEKGDLAFINHEKFHNDMIQGILEDLSEEHEGIFIDSLKKVTYFFESKYNLIIK